MSGPRLSIIPARAATDRALKPRDLQVLCVLGRHTDDYGWCRRSQVKMADEMGCARATVFEAIERLIKAGYLERFKQESDSNRDSAHVYRVILDPQHPNVAAVVDGDPPCRYVGTPAGMSAPPAGPEPAPPAGPEPAPINDSSLTTPANHERERERARREEDKRIKHGFERAWQAWPTSLSDSRPAALKAWFGLSPQDRDAAFTEMPRWLEANRKNGRQYMPTFGSYLATRRWANLEHSAAEPAKALTVPPFGPGMASGVYSHLLLMPPSDKIPGLLPWERQAVHAGRLVESELRLQKQALHGWPTVNNAFRAAGEARPTGVFSVAEVGLPAELFEPVPVGCARWHEWHAEHARRGWPWLPDPGRQRAVFFPAGGPGRLVEFEALVKGSSDVGNARDAAA